MSSSISAVTSVTSQQSSGLDALMRDMARSIEEQEKAFRDSFAEGLKPGGELMGIPKHVRDQFKLWDETFTNPEERKLVAELKSRIIEISTNTQEYIGERVTQNAKKFQLEMAMKAAGKATSGIQQLLSAQ
ncbi:MAG: hypothetical protein MUE98_01470 [Rhodobacteraceae bacterium]|jgi:hypothetical protein|nr:hypothetical protein [Paracoccaceae bacterium]